MGVTLFFFRKDGRFFRERGCLMKVECEVRELLPKEEECLARGVESLAKHLLGMFERRTPGHQKTTRLT
jgi:hypothetical protein